MIITPFVGEQLPLFEIPPELIEVPDADGFLLSAGDRIIDQTCNKRCCGWVQSIQRVQDSHEIVVWCQIDGRAAPEPYFPENLSHWELHVRDPQNLDALWEAVNRIRADGEAAPTGVEWNRYRKQKQLASGEVKTYPLDGYYYSVVHPDKPVLLCKGKPTKALHIGRIGTPLYLDWCHRFRRRRQLKLLYAQIKRLS